MSPRQASDRRWFPGGQGRVLRAIGSWQRVKRCPATGGEIAHILGVTRQTVHHHAKALRAAGFLESPLIPQTQRCLGLTETGRAAVLSMLGKAGGK